MAIKICVLIQKGGSAKTTTAVNLAANLQASGYKVLLIDMDNQGDSSFSLGINPRTLDYSAYNVLTTNKLYVCDIQDAILKTDYCDIVPGDGDIDELALDLDSIYHMKTIFSAVDDKYDFIIMDSVPQMNIIARNEMAASNYIIVPMEPKPFHYTGMVNLIDTFNEVKAKYNPALKVLGILLVRHTSRFRLDSDIKELIDNYAKQMDTVVFKHSIRDGLVVPKSQLAQKPLIAFDPMKTKRTKLQHPTIDYMGFTKEVLEMIRRDRDGKEDY